MKVATFAIVILALLVGFAIAETLSDVRPEKVEQITDPGKFDGEEGGETIETAPPIPFLPYCDTGNTCDNINDYDEVCPYTGSTSPDVVYKYMATFDGCISISLCNSYYDTKVYVYEDAWTPGNPVACNDDNFDCVNPPVSYTSWIPECPVYTGHDYYIVVDGYGGACGDYVIEIDQVTCTPPCNIDCVGNDEGEPDCYDGYVDMYNAGCGSDPESWQLLPTSPVPYTICGTSGNYDDNYNRDTDWFLMYPCGGVPITLTVEAEFLVLFGFVDMRSGCAGAALYSYAYAGECEIVQLTEYLPMGQFAVWISTSGWLNVPCGKEYSLTVEGYDVHCDPTAVEDVSWGLLKGLYK